MKRIRLMALPVLALLVASTTQAYYHYVHFASQSGPFQEIPEKFDLTALNNKTVRYFINDQGPGLYYPNDNFNAVVSEIRAAARVWNDVTTSDLRLAFGGFEPSNVSPAPGQVAPGIDVIFNDSIGPGLIALGGVSVRGGITPGPNGSFVPIARSILQLRNDLSQQPPSFSESFFTTLVHEFGHTLGLQHTLTSSVMSTQITRATSKSAPLAADDIAGISLLYPSASFVGTTGSITGRVTLNGTGVGLASVVAISPSGPAVSNLTNPDGTFRIDGIPAGQYYVYAHPLPLPVQGVEATPANVIYPKDALGNPIPPGPLFDTIFYQATKDWSQASPVFVAAGASFDGVNFAVQSRSTEDIYAIQTYGFIGQNAVKSPPLLVGSSQATVVAAGNGLLQGSSIPSGLQVSTIGGAVPVVPGSLKPYYAPPYIQWNLTPSSGSGPRHMTFLLNNELYVLPAAFTLVESNPPAISSATPTFDSQGNRAVLITGTNLSSNTRIVFEGSSGTIRSQNPDGSLLVTPPSGAGSYTANVAALNADGQSSLFVQGNTPTTYTYDPIGPASITASPAALPTGVTSLVDVIGVNTNFVDGATALGFGSSDIVVQQVWVLTPTHLVANVVVSPAALPGLVDFSVVSGIQTILQPSGFQVQPGSFSPISLGVPIVNSVSGQSATPAGGTAILNVNNLNVPATSLTLTVAGQQATILSSFGGQIVFQVPAATVAGAAVVRLQDTAGDAIPAVIMQVSAPPPSIIGAFTSGTVPIDANHPAHPNDLVTVAVSGLGDPTTIALSRVQANAGGVPQPIVALSASTTQPGVALAQFVVNPLTPTGTAVPLTFGLDGAFSQAVPIVIRSF